MPLRLRVIPSGKAKGRARKAVPGEGAIEFDDGVGQIRIGRRPDLELSLPFSPLSGVHARLVRVGGEQGAGGAQSASGRQDAGWLLEDLGSTNGTFVGGERLKPGVKRALVAGTQIALAQVKLIFDGEVPGDDATATYVRRQISDLFSPGPTASTAPFLAVVAGIKGGETFRFAERNHHYVLGRDKACDFRIKDEQVSREHAVFTWRDQGVEVADLGSANGVLLNGEHALEPRRLYDGDLVQVGPVKMRFFNPSENAPSENAEQASHVPAVDAAGVRATPTSATAAADQSSTFRSRLHPAVAGALSAERSQVRPSAQRVAAYDRTLASRSRTSVYLLVVAAAVVLALAALVGGLTAR
jgi:pSer/pThr/pTyr-binding forkhead associated (FHA) protein